MNAFWNRPINFIFLNSTNAALSLARQERIAIAISSLLVIIHNNYDEPFGYTSNPPLHDSVNLVHHYPRIYSLHYDGNHAQVNTWDETRLTVDSQSDINIPDMYKSHSDEFRELRFEFADMWYGHLRRIKTANT